MTPIVHTIEVGEIIAARTWKIRASTRYPDIIIDQAAYSSRNLITERGDAPRVSFALESNQQGMWPIEGRLKAACIEDPMERGPRDCKFACGAPCTIRLNAFRDSSYASCPCGIYAFNLKGVMMRVSNFMGRISTTYARGLVALSGRVIEHSLGYRAEFARPIALLSNDETSHSSFTTQSLIKCYNANQLPSFTELVRALAIDEHRRESEPSEDSPCP